MENVMPDRCGRAVIPRILAAALLACAASGALAQESRTIHRVSPTTGGVGVIVPPGPTQSQQPGEGRPPHRHSGGGREQIDHPYHPPQSSNRGHEQPSGAVLKNAGKKQSDQQVQRAPNLRLWLDRALALAVLGLAAAAIARMPGHQQPKHRQASPSVRVTLTADAGRVRIIRTRFRHSGAGI
jgi:hypothetical protein